MLLLLLTTVVVLIVELTIDGLAVPKAVEAEAEGEEMLLLPPPLLEGDTALVKELETL